MVATATYEVPVSQAGKGHVPESYLDAYRQLARHARQLDTLGNTLSGKGEHEDAMDLWALSQKYWGKANALRVDL